ncbi:MAG: hypothetical protein R6X20_00170 [Phycisphaerae bacterium]
MATRPPQPEDGLRCPTCGCRHLLVVYTRHRTIGGRTVTIRCRECRHCGRRIVTHERPIGDGQPPPAAT